MGKSKPERPPNLGTNVLRIENRIQMFCYYNTLAWEILAAALASVIVLATLPFVVKTEFIEKTFLAFVCLLILGGGAGLFCHLRGFASRWIMLPWENDSTSPKAWIDYVEIGDWKTSWSPRTKKTNFQLIVFLGVAWVITVLAWFLFGLKQ